MSGAVADRCGSIALPPCATPLAGRGDVMRERELGAGAGRRIGELRPTRDDGRPSTGRADMPLRGDPDATRPDIILCPSC